MSLTHSDKAFIRKETKNLNLVDLSKKLNKSESEIKSYLEKKWKKEKLKKYLTLNKKIDQTIPQANSTWNLSAFIKENKKIFLLLFALIGISYLNALNNDFVSDDRATLLVDESYRSINNLIQNPTALWVKPFLSFISYSIGGLNPFFFRLPFVLTHILSACVIFILGSKLTNKNVGLFSSCLFAVHPILIEGVTWISGGGYSMYTAFFLLSLLLYTESSQSKKSYVFSIIFYVISLSSYATGSISFLILALYESIFGNLKISWKNLVPYFALATLWGLVTFVFIPTRISALQNSYYNDQSGFENPLIQIPTAITDYFRLIIWPSNLTLYHTEFNTSAIVLMIRYIFFSTFLTSIFILLKKKSKYAFWPLFFLISLLPTLTPFRISWTVAERYAYLGSVGLFISIGIIISYIIKKSPELRKFIFAGFFLIITIFMIRTIIRNEDWKNEDNLWIATAKTSPSSPNTHNNMGDVYSRRKQYDKAIEEFTLATQIKPNYADAYHNLANTYQSIGDAENAIKNYKLAIKYNPNIWQSHVNIGVLEVNKKNYEIAEQSLLKAISLNQDENIATYLGQVYLLNNKKEEAKNIFVQVLQSNPNNKEAKEGYLKSIEK